jgi:tetratricopeptide (TPR) repeat protein
MRSYGLALTKYKQSIKLRERTGELGYKAMALVNCAYVFHAVKDYDKEISYSKDALKFADTDTIRSYAHLSLGKGYIGKKDYVKGIRHLQKSLFFKERSGDVVSLWKDYIQVGNTYLRVGQYDSAIATYWKVEPISAGNPQILSRMYIVLGTAFHFKNKFDQAETFYKRGISYHYNDDLGCAYLNLAELSFQRGKQSAATQYLDSAIKYPHTLEHLAKTYEALGRSKDGLLAYKKLVNTIVTDYEQLIPYHSDVVNAEYKMMYEDQINSTKEMYELERKYKLTVILVGILVLGLLAKYLYSAYVKVRESKIFQKQLREIIKSDQG